jgi:hypothetical protein
MKKRIMALGINDVLPFILSILSILITGNTARQEVILDL